MRAGLKTAGQLDVARWGDSTCEIVHECMGACVYECMDRHLLIIADPSAAQHAVTILRNCCKCFQHACLHMHLYTVKRTAEKSPYGAL